MGKEIDLVIIGDIAYNQSITPAGERRVLGGAVYDVAVASSLFAEEGTVGVVTKAGEDSTELMESLASRHVDTAGVAIIPGEKTTVLNIEQHEDGSRDMVIETNIPDAVDTTIFPQSYKNAKHVHLASSHPRKYLQWIPYLRQTLPKESTISADACDFFLPEESNPMIEALQSSDLVFLNEKEDEMLRGAGYQEEKPTILKRGERGATYIDKGKGIEIYVAAPKVKVVDTLSAGDTLAGAYLARRMQGASIHESLQEGVRVSAKTVTDFGVEHIGRK